MTLEEFQILYKRFSKFPLSKETQQMKEYDDYINAMDENQEFQDWITIQRLESKNFNYKEYCCITMADNIYESKDSKGNIKYDEVDVIMNKWDNGTYGIPIHDGGTSIIVINFCPWCGENLKKSN